MVPTSNSPDLQRPYEQCATGDSHEDCKISCGIAPETWLMMRTVGRELECTYGLRKHQFEPSKYLCHLYLRLFWIRWVNRKPKSNIYKAQYNDAMMLCLVVWIFSSFFFKVKANLNGKLRLFAVIWAKYAYILLWPSAFPTYFFSIDNEIHLWSTKINLKELSMGILQFCWQALPLNKTLKNAEIRKSQIDRYIIDNMYYYQAMVSLSKVLFLFLSFWSSFQHTISLSIALAHSSHILSVWNSCFKRKIKWQGFRCISQRILDEQKQSVCSA